MQRFSIKPSSIKGSGNKECEFLNEKGVSLLEVLVVLLVLSIIVGGLSELLAGGLKAARENRSKAGLTDNVNYAMSRIISATRESNWVFIPGNASPVRDLFVISAMVDNDHDDVIDEDWGVDTGNDGQPGLTGFDDDGDGSIDEGGAALRSDDDEDGVVDEDIPRNGVDDDSDGNYDEELRVDMNGDGCPGVCGKDDDGDGSIDEGNVNDDDEDGMVNEDPVDPLIYYVKNGALYEKKIVWNPVTGSSDITENKLVENLIQFRVERLMGVNGKTLISVRMEVSDGRGGSVALESAVHPRILPAVTP